MFGPRLNATKLGDLWMCFDYLHTPGAMWFFLVGPEESIAIMARAGVFAEDWLARERVYRSSRGPGPGPGRGHGGHWVS